MRGEPSFEKMMEGVRQAQKEHPEDFPFVEGEKVLVKPKPGGPGRAEKMRFASWDTETGDAFFTTARKGEEHLTHGVVRIKRADLGTRVEKLH